MAIVSAQANYALNMQVEVFRWSASRVYSADQVLVEGGIIDGRYTGNLSAPAGQLPTGTLDEYDLVYNGSRTEWKIFDLGIDARQFFTLLDAGRQTDAMAFALQGNDGLFGSSKDDVLSGFGGDDKFFDDAGKDQYDGGAGVDTVDYLARSKFFTLSVTNNGSAFIDRTAPANADKTTNVELVHFDGDGVTIDLRFLIEARFAQADQYKDMLDMYSAYFNRAPDAYGIAYWASRLYEGMSLSQIAKSFFVQPETLAAFPASMTTTQFVTQVYANALGRAPDAPGLAYWVHDLETGNQTRDGFMLAMIYGARASTGSPVDAQYLANKGEVGKYFALAQGLGDVQWAKEAMIVVNETPQSVIYAKHLIDDFAARAATPEEAHLLLPFVGLLHDMPA